jgi:hypothetical protein
MGKKRWMIRLIAAILFIACGVGIWGIIDRRAASERQVQYEAVLKGLAC